MILFVDLKAAFPLVNRRILWKTIKERRIKAGIVERINELYTDVRARVRIGEKMG